MRIALALIVKGSDEEAELLSRLLENITQSGAIDGLFITRTHRKGEKPSEAVKKVFDLYKEAFDTAQLSEFEWVFDFAAARNYNFSQVTKDFDYILWCDADDVWRGLENLKDTLDENKGIDAFAFDYLYDWDEFKNPTVVHKKTMLVRNDGCVTWQGRLHEDLAENRQLEFKVLAGIDRMHLSTKERAAENAKRNLEISEVDVKENPDDPRTYWNLANSRFGVADFEGARDAFEHFILHTESEDEKYLAYLRVGEVYKCLNNRSEAIKHLQTAIGIKPHLPDAYFQLSYLHFSYGNLDKAELYCITGMQRRPEPNRMIVFNPRDYDYNPMRLLASIYYEKNRPDKMVPLLEGCLEIYPKDEKLKRLVAEGREMKRVLGEALETIERLQGIEDSGELGKELDALPDDIKSHPAVCKLRNERFTKTESSGRDLVIYCGMTHHEWNPELFKSKGFGGSEEAVVHLAREWAKLGWNVTVYNSCGHRRLEYTHEGKLIERMSYHDFRTDFRAKVEGKHVRDVPMVGITYRPFWEWNYRDKQDVTILWRWPKALDVDINSTKIFVDLHDVVPDGEFNEKRIAKVDKVFVKSQFHRSLFPSLPDEKVIVVPNGFETYDVEAEKDPLLVINTSSPDRSMDVLPKLWKRVREKVPNAKFKWAYGFDVYKAAHADDQKKIAWMEQVIKEMDEAGIEQLGKLPQAEVAKLYAEASFIAYPTEFAEICCISVKKAQAAKCAVVATDFGALSEAVEFGYLTHSTKTKDTWAKPYQFHFGLEDEKAQDEWVDTMVRLLKEGPRPESYWKDLPEWREQYRWENVAAKWNEILNF